MELTPNFSLVSGMPLGSSSTSHKKLFASLGSFWTQIFSQKQALEGLTLAQSEELIQKYYNFLEILDALSIKEIKTEHKERWYPLRVKKSQFRRSPLLFLPEGAENVAYFGPQPATVSAENPFAHEVFQFGRSKRPVDERYCVELPDTIKNIPLIADRLVAPTAVFSNGIEFQQVGNKLYFNSDLFSDPRLTKYRVLGEAGAPMTFEYQSTIYKYDTSEDVGEPENGTQIAEEEILLWGSHTSLDVDMLYNHFGYIFDFKEHDLSAYKKILQGVVNLLVEGPTVAAVSTLLSSFLGVDTANGDEIVQDAYEIDGEKFVVTDKHVYKASAFYSFSSKVYNVGSGLPKAGVHLQAGDLLFDAISYHDNVLTPGWWKDPSVGGLGFPSYLFSGEYSGALIFENRWGGYGVPVNEVVLTAPDNVVFPFPTSVPAEDRATFSALLNNSVGRGLLVEHAAGNSDVVNPLAFMFDYFFKTNTVYYRLNLQNLSHASLFTKIFSRIRPYLPAYLYLVFSVDLPAFNDEASFTAGGSAVTSSDTSDVSGWIQVPDSSKKVWNLTFGYPEEEEDELRSFVVGRSLDLVTSYEDEYGEFYANTPDLDGEFVIPVDEFNVSQSVLSGEEKANWELVYNRTGQVGIIAGSVHVVGYGTDFLKDLKVGNRIYVYSPPTGYRTITQIITDNLLRIDSPFEGASRVVDLRVNYLPLSTKSAFGLMLLNLS